MNRLDDIKIEKITEPKILGTGTHNTQSYLNTDNTFCLTLCKCEIHVCPRYSDEECTAECYTYRD